MIKPPNVEAFYERPGLNHEAYYNEGDLNLGALFAVRDSGENVPCQEGGYRFRKVQSIEAVVFAIKQINSRKDILPNVTLGWVAMDECKNAQTSLARALRFIKLQDKVQQACSGDPDCMNYDVVGVVGFPNSNRAVLVSQMLSFFKIPHISNAAGSEFLSDPENYPYLIRLAPSNKYEAKAMVDVIRHFGWTYVAVVSQEGAYGGPGIREVKKLARKYDICIAYEAYTIDESTIEDYDRIAKGLVSSRARVVVLFVSSSEASEVMEGVKRINATHDFLWFTSDLFRPHSTQYVEQESKGKSMLQTNLIPPKIIKFEHTFTPLRIVRGIEI